jgi:osmoprotectant transport system substrate-binding protein
MTARTTRFLLPLAAVALIAAGCGDSDDADTGTDAGATDTASDEEAAPAGPTIRVRGQDFSESITIAEVYGQYLEAKGYDTEILTAAGFRDEAVTALEADELDLIVDYIGGSQAQLAPDAEPSSDPNQVIETITPLYEEIGATVLEFSTAENIDAFVVRGDEEAAAISDVPDGEYVFGASAQCFERPQCYIGLTSEDFYGIEFADEQTLEFGSLLGEALAAEEVDAVVWNSTAPQIDAEGFKILTDDLGLFPAQNIAPIIRTEVLDEYGDQLTEDLNALSEAISTEDLVAWNTGTDIELRESDEVAAEWLEEEGLV